MNYKVLWSKPLRRLLNGLLVVGCKWYHSKPFDLDIYFDDAFRNECVCVKNTWDNG